MKINLNGIWTMTRQSDGESFPAVIPGTDFGALINAGEIANPLLSGVADEALKTASDSYSFFAEFTVPDEYFKKNIIKIKCACIDTLCDCYINYKYSFSLQNSFVPLDKEIKQFLHTGKNCIEFRFHSPYLFIKQKYKEKPLLPNPNGVNGIPYIRKPACHFGWDWGPCIPYCGILDDIYIECCDREITDIRIKQDTEKDFSALQITCNGADTIAVLSPDGNEVFGINGCYSIENPSLWYTHDLSQKDKQPLYTVILKNDDMCIKKQIGLRTIQLDTSPDIYGRNFCFILNNEPIFAKGANLIPFSTLYEDSNHDTIDYYIRLAKKAGFNMLRIWGGGSYASEYLLKRCDEEGILVWQDFCFACQMYPFYDIDFLDNIMDETVANVTRMDTHACVALWCGNNEIETMFPYIPKYSKLRKSYVDFFYRILPGTISQYTDRNYIPTSPLGRSPFVKNTDDSQGDTHMWNVWHGLKKLNYYQNRYTRFMSEFGLESLPSVRAISSFAAEKEMTLNSQPFRNHQKCRGGNRKMIFYLTELFDFPKQFDYLPYLTGIVQAECIKNAAVHFRQNKGRCNGCLFWQFNDVWNCPSWSSVDFEGVPKALQYNASDFFAPVAVTCRKEKNKAYIVAHNDTLDSVQFNVTLTYYTPQGRYLREDCFPVSLEKNSRQFLREIHTDPKEILRIRYLDKDMTELFTPPYKLPLQKADIAVVPDGNDLLLTSNTFAYNVFIETDGVSDENYICLYKGETTRIHFEKKTQLLRVLCANNIEFKKNPLRKELFRLGYRLQPSNIANYIIYSVM